MALSLMLLKTGVVSTSAPTGPVYAPSASNPNKAAIVYCMRFTNGGSGVAKLRAWFLKAGNTFSSDARRILPYDAAIPPGCTLTEDVQLTLGPGDGICLQGDTGNIDFVFSGLEREQA